MWSLMFHGYKLPLTCHAIEFRFHFESNGQLLTDFKQPSDIKFSCQTDLAGWLQGGAEGRHNGKPGLKWTPAWSLISQTSVSTVPVLAFTLHGVVKFLSTGNLGVQLSHFIDSQISLREFK